jgi:hypothetical protein
VKRIVRSDTQSTIDSTLEKLLRLMSGKCKLVWYFNDLSGADVVDVAEVRVALALVIIFHNQADENHKENVTDWEAKQVFML